MQTSTITLEGTIYFDPDDVTSKHKEQSSWKKMALVVFNSDVSEYYAWFIKKRYNIELNKPLRGAHISFINDHVKDISNNWVRVKKKWHKKKINITLSIDPRTDDKHWWLNIPEEHRTDLHAIRNELGLGRPYWGLHMTIGHANEKNIEHSIYIHRLIKKGLIILD